MTTQLTATAGVFDVSPGQVPAGAVVVGYDGSQDADRALTWAAEQASLEGRPLVVTYAVDVSRLLSYGFGGVESAPIISSQDWARSVSFSAGERALGDHPGLHVRVAISDDDPRLLLASFSVDAHLLVLGARGRGPLAGALLGSVSANVVRHASCPVVVLRPGSHGGDGNGVVVGADGRVGSTAVVEQAFRMASLRRLPLTVAHAFNILPRSYFGDVPASETEIAEEGVLLAESVAGLSEQFPDVVVTRVLEQGHLPDLLVGPERHWDLVVLGHHHRSLTDRLTTESMALQVLQSAQTGVMVVPQGR